MNGRTKPVLVRFVPAVLAALDAEVKWRSSSTWTRRRTDVLMDYIVAGLGVDHRGVPRTAEARRRHARYIAPRLADLR
jgi:hypothetical protein